MFNSTFSFQSCSRPLVALGLALASFGLGCGPAEPGDDFDEPELVRGLAEQEQAPSLSADTVLAEAEELGYLEIARADISEAELDKLLDQAQRVTEFASEAEAEQVLDFATGELALRNTAPVGLDSGDFDWSELALVEEHSRVFSFLAARGLMNEVEDTLAPGTWLSPALAEQFLTKAEAEALASHSFETFTSVDDALGGDPVPLNHCIPTTPTTCTEGCGDCQFEVLLVNNRIIFLVYRICWEHCSNDCGCTGTTQSTQGC